MKVLTYTSSKKHYDLYSKIHGSFAVNSCQIELAQKRCHFTIKYPHNNV